MVDRFEEMAERVRLDLELYGVRQSIDGRRRVIAEALRAAYERGAEEAYEQGRRDALREAIDLCQRTEAGDTNHDWREAAKCCRELIESLAAQAAEEAAR